MEQKDFTFELVDKYAPDIVIKNAIKDIEIATKGWVIASIDNYGGHVFSYKKEEGFNAALEALTSRRTVDVNIQEDLGEQSNDKHKFEVYLLVKGLEHYKYRMMFIEYGAIAYPVNIILNESLAKTYSGKNTYIYQLKSMNEVEQMMETILNSPKMHDLLQSLINEALRREQMMETDSSIQNDE